MTILFSLGTHDKAQFKRALKHIEITDSDCHLWRGVTGLARPKTYGTVNLLLSASVRVNRVAYAYHKGSFDNDLVVRHTCDNPTCVNPAHLITGTQLDNIYDGLYRGHIGTSNPYRVLNSEAVKVIKWMLKYKNYHGLTAKLAKLYKCSHTTIGRIKNNKIWSEIKV